MAQHYGLIPKDIAENIAKANNKPYTTFVSKGYQVCKGIEIKNTS